MNKGEIPLRLTLGKQNIEAQAIEERFSCQYEKSSDIVWAVRAHNWNNSFLHIEIHAGTVSCQSRGSQWHLPLMQCRSYPHSNLHEFHYSPNTCTLPQNVAQNLSATWCSTFRIVEAQCPSITEITLKSPFLCVVWFSGLYKSYSCTQYIQWEQQTIKGVYLIINLYINNNNDSRYNNNKNKDTNKSYWLWL